MAGENFEIEIGPTRSRAQVTARRMTVSSPTEAAWTAPSDWCPRPDLWHSEDTEATEHEVSELAGAMVRALQPRIAVETGTYKAQTALAIARAIAANGHGHLFTIEADPGLAALAAHELEGLPATVIRADASTWEPEFVSAIGFAWIDSGLLSTVPGAVAGRPMETARLTEITRLLPCFAPGAVIGIHDTRPGRGVLESLAPLFSSGALLPGITLRTPRGVTFAQVPMTHVPVLPDRPS